MYSNRQPIRSNKRCHPLMSMYNDRIDHYVVDINQHSLYHNNVYHMLHENHIAYWNAAIHDYLLSIRVTHPIYVDLRSERLAYLKAKSKKRIEIKLKIMNAKWGENQKWKKKVPKLNSGQMKRERERERKDRNPRINDSFLSKTLINIIQIQFMAYCYHNCMYTRHFQIFLMVSFRFVSPVHLFTPLILFCFFLFFISFDIFNPIRKTK